jgi:hypothetical protein
MPAIIATIEPTAAPTEEGGISAWFYGIMATVIPGLLVGCITKPNLFRDWVRVVTCQHRRGVVTPTEEEEEEEEEEEV